ncbi:phosphoribosylanthranilate isomerase [Halobacillus karajensis]|uniref:N-(5'-phosphoribosyl)anthranilate isomerase n=1 Tax=Halobacillus karajensis TaxID=195088 RepID=A0A024P646_9BACI|nr:phosphoribosylanthranilate isomerase [Halobacillus karajensis]CDQ20415.1 N-(5'-phosphoribosyl)anthranilate isomerase [Halobacillus karajensis]CDQ24116.1 N-(5'-phosphoribosyl)anthranilate isomerase [Halobacillus karajensis]CDQ27594.1 N-(5'-phosphoribosyl)anthranilate isomerase [Halobacillus karajensis]SEH92010.1 phosphoribosylanthranilate isomerase [Halobacillus karajensis]
MKEPIVKLCGNRSLSDLAKTSSSHASHLGFIFVRRTKRYVRPESVGRWVKKIRPKQKLVGVFIDPTIEEIEETLQFVPLDVIQLHGNETVSQLLRIKEAVGLPVWKVIHHQSGGIDQMDVFRGVADGYIVDSKVDGAAGGTGVRFDWEAIPSYRDEAYNQGVPCFVAGGINPENIKELLTYRPDGIDLSSGIEIGERKDIGKIQTILKEVEQNVASIS